jgi:hypothetical protein
VPATAPTVNCMAWEVEKRYWNHEDARCTSCDTMTAGGMIIEVYVGTPQNTIMDGLLCEQCYERFTAAETAG